MKGVLAVVVVACAAIGVARAQNRIALDEIVGSWQGDDELQYVELRMLAAAPARLANAAALIFDDASGSTDGRRARDPHAERRARRRGREDPLASAKSARHCSASSPTSCCRPASSARSPAACATRSSPATASPAVDCVAYGDFTGDNGAFGPPTPLTPDNRALQRVRASGRNRTDWTTRARPGPRAEHRRHRHAAGDALRRRHHLAGRGVRRRRRSAARRARRSASRRASSRACSATTTRASAPSCGNDAINGKEECDGGDLGERTCDSLGYTAARSPAPTTASSRRRPAIRRSSWPAAARRRPTASGDGA